MKKLRNDVPTPSRRLVGQNCISVIIDAFVDVNTLPFLYKQ